MTDFADSARFVALPRLTGLVLSPDESRLVVVRAQPDGKGARYASALWQVDPAGVREATRLTRSEKGESQPAFRPDGSLLFIADRPEPGGADDGAALWELPAWGEPRALARTPGGLAAPLVAQTSGTVLVSGSRLAGAPTELPAADPASGDAASGAAASGDAASGDSAKGDVASGDLAAVDRAARKDRDERKLNHILHDGFPIRYWDHELDDAWPRLFVLDGDGLRDLTGDTRQELLNASVSVTADGRIAATTWHVRRRAGQTGYALALLDVGTGAVRMLADDERYLYEAPTISPDGRYVAAIRETTGDFDTPLTCTLVVFEVDGATDPVEVPVGAVYPGALVWSGDSSTLVVSGDLRGRGAVLAVRAGTWTVSTLAQDAVYTSICVNLDGSTVYALRSTVDRSAYPVRLAGDGTQTELRSPDPAPELPGYLTEVDAIAPDGARVRGWLCVPHDASATKPAPVQLWIHGGPFGSWNAWSWRWSPWMAVARGYAVLLVDPALSTGYGPDWLARAWPHRAAPVWADLETVLDATLRRPELDATRTACLGGSFGGYMTNWVAGHTDRFAAIVTHAGLWALDQQHATTDAADWKSGLFGTRAEHSEWYAQNSPHNFIDAISTPMLVVHGNKDYRVPVSEALRLWWDLVSHFDGPPEALPHRFLQFTNENHWILSPANAQVWYDTVLDFVDRHVAGGSGPSLAGGAAHPDHASALPGVTATVE